VTRYWPREIRRDKVRIPHQAFEDPMLERRQLDDVAEPDDRVLAAIAARVGYPLRPAARWSNQERHRAIRAQDF
jgi:hypothetical protein